MKKQNKQFVVSETKMRHKDRRNISETTFWGPFKDEESANEYAGTIIGKLVEVYEINTPKEEE